VDSNDAISYLVEGHRILRERGDPRRAMAMFQWAARLEPASAEAPLGEAQALARSLPARPDPRDLARLDSLIGRALFRDPLALADPAAFAAIVPGKPSRTAVAIPGDGLTSRVFAAGAHWRAGRYDSAAAALEAALAVVRGREAQRIGAWSKALFVHGVGLAALAAGDTTRAREAFARALEEDFAFWPAHVALGGALAPSDPDAAARALELAAQLAPHEPLVRFEYGTVLLRARRLEAAVEQLREAVRLAPDYANGWHNLALAHDLLGQRPHALFHYYGFLDRAPRRLATPAARAHDRIVAMTAGEGRDD
jgi:tetratricopeptide (TPR) repeat protein